MRKLFLCTHLLPVLLLLLGGGGGPAPAHACTKHADCAAGEWCGTPGGQGNDRCVAPNTTRGQIDPSWCSCMYAKTWDCPANTEWGNLTCCRPVPSTWPAGTQPYASGCPRADQWCRQGGGGRTDGAS